MAAEDTAAQDEAKQAKPPVQRRPEVDPDNPDARAARRNRHVFVVGFLGGLGLMCAIILTWAVRETLSVLLLMLAALFLAIGLHPAVTWLQRRGLPRGLAVAVVVLGVVLVGCGGLGALAPPLITQTGELVTNLPGYLDELNRNQQVADFSERYHLIDRLKEAVTSENITKALGGALGGVRAVFGAIFNVLTVFVLTIYFLAAWTRLKEGFYKLFPASRRDTAREIGDEIFEKIGAYLLGSLAIAFVAGVSTFVFLLIVGVSYAFALAMVVAVCDLIPQIGATLGAIVVVVAGFAHSPEAGIAAVIFFILYQQLENWVIAPRVLKRSVDVSDLAVILSALIGAVLLGALGALIAIPVVAAVQLTMRKIAMPHLDRI
ncbi:AI-2E family transporter [Catellatospora methionotrophica]|uniref:AI-2E family transporter n=1 Tax=Catellatospora methionotrophica TaxID=121620 RepID=A0A8J3LST3_9ACTN|nr:AI-2E family transporter [Catellatospora methionotrophica]GIG18225.1 AI-2E family transporter [Catellatospora methionotrophica]